MHNLRLHGNAPYTVAVIHGGPGAPGSMAAVARELCAERGILEPLQTAGSLDGQVEELRDTVTRQGAPPVTLIGWSWGAMLSFITAARHPDLVRKVILVSSGVFEEQYAPSITETRLSRLTGSEKTELAALRRTLDDPAAEENAHATLARIGRLFKTRTDSVSLLPDPDDDLPVDFDIHRQVWHDAHQLRQRGDLLALGRRITCPVIAIHGDTDPHPLAGIQQPLASVLRDFRLHVLARCGHYPWLEREARDAFFDLLRRELA